MRIEEDKNDDNTYLPYVIVLGGEGHVEVHHCKGAFLDALRVYYEGGYERPRTVRQFMQGAWNLQWMGGPVYLRNDSKDDWICRALGHK